MGKKAVEIRKKLAAQDPTVDALDKLAYSYSNLGYAEGDFVAGNQALNIWEDLQKRFPSAPQFRPLRRAFLKRAGRDRL